jgi:hypothetical protein
MVVHASQIMYVIAPTCVNHKALLEMDNVMMEDSVLYSTVLSSLVMEVIARVLEPVDNTQPEDLQLDGLPSLLVL